MSLFKRARFLTRFFVAVVKKQYKIVILGLVLGAVFFIILPRILKIVPQIRQTEKIGLIGQFEIYELPEVILNDLSYGLTRISAKGEAEGLISSGWEVGNDGKTYTFTLNDQAREWHDGKDFKLSEVNYNFKDVAFNTSGNQMVFTLKEPFSPFPVILSRPLFKKGLIGLGKYRAKKIEMQGKYVKSILLVPYGQSTIFSNDENAALPNKLYRFYDNERQMRTAFNLGEVNLIKDLPDLSGLFLNRKIKISQRTRQDAYLAVFLNTKKAVFQDKTFRQALAYAIPKETGEKRALGPLNPGSWAYNPDVKPYLLDLPHARELLGEQSSTDKAKIRIFTFPQYESQAGAVKEALKQLGYDSEIQIITFIPEDFDVLIIAREIPEDPDQYYFWHSTQAGNIANFNSPRIDKLLEDGRRVSGREERKSLYFDFQRFLVEESPVIFLTHPVSYSVTRS